jgi:hypothetical protein
MAGYSLAMLVLAIGLSEHNEAYEDMVVKFVEQFAMINDALERSGLYDEDDGIFYDRLSDASGGSTLIKVQTLVGILPMFPAGAIPWTHVSRLSPLRHRFARVLEQLGRSELRSWRMSDDDGPPRILVSVVSPEQLHRVLGVLLDEEAFLSPYGLRSLSKRHTQPYSVPGLPGAVIDYQPAESRTPMYGGNSNWRGPVWFPTNYLMTRTLLQYEQFFGPEHAVEYPTGSGEKRTLRQISSDLAERMISIWLPGPDGRRPVYGGAEIFQSDPAWKDNLLFFEYFHGDNGAGLGASHQTGWTALVIDLILDPPSHARVLGAS